MRSSVPPSKCFMQRCRYGQRCSMMAFRRSVRISLFISTSYNAPCSLVYLCHAFSAPTCTKGSWERPKENGGEPGADQDGKLPASRMCAAKRIFRGNGGFSKHVQAGATDPFETAVNLRERFRKRGAACLFDQKGKNECPVAGASLAQRAGLRISVYVRYIEPNRGLLLCWEEAFDSPRLQL